MDNTISFLPIDVGFDLHVHSDIVVDLSSHISAGQVAISYMQGEDTKHFSGPVACAYAALRAAGYTTLVSSSS